MSKKPIDNFLKEENEHVEENKTNFNLQEQLNQITLIDAPETKAAKKILRYLSSKFILMIIIPFILIIFTLPIQITNSNTFLQILTILELITFFCNILGYFAILMPYFKLLKLAKRNDRVRHEEKIRINERRLMENTKPKIINKNDLDFSNKNFKNIKNN